MNEQSCRTARKFFKRLKLSQRKISDQIDPTLFRSSYRHMSQGDRWLVLEGQNLNDYNHIQKELSGIYPKSQKYGRSYVEGLLRDTVWAALENTATISQVVDEAVAQLIAGMTIPAQNWTVYYPVSGFILRPRLTSWQFGSIKFLTTRNRAMKAILKPLHTPPVVISNSFINTYAEVSVSAIDLDTAIALARQQIDLHVSVINGLASLVENTRYGQTLSHYGEIGERRHAWAAYKNAKTMNFSRCMSYALFGFSPHLLRGSQYMRLVSARTLYNQLKNGPADIYEKRILPSLKWSGKALNQNTEEEAFLFYCLALEAIFYEDTVKESVMEGLKDRIYKFLFTNRMWSTSAIDAFKRFDSLYKLRSQIVHRGGIEVSSEDLEHIQNLVGGCMFKFMQYPYFRRMKTSQEFEAWLSK